MGSKKAGPDKNQTMKDIPPIKDINPSRKINTSKMYVVVVPNPEEIILCVK